MDDHAHRQPQELVDLAHPLGIALGQVVVDRDHVHAVASQGVQVAGQGGHQRLALAGLHFRDFALVQHHAADQLYVEVTHLDRAPAGLAHHCEDLGKNLVQGLALGRLHRLGVSDSFEPGRNPLPELDGFGPQLVVGKPFGVLFQSVDRRHHRH